MYVLHIARRGEETGYMPQAIQIEKGSLVVKTVAVFSILL